jgi:hypothetical protein
VFEDDIRDIQDDDLPQHKKEYMFYLLFELPQESYDEILSQSQILTNHIKILTECLLLHYGMEYEKNTKHFHTHTIQNRLNVLKKINTTLIYHISTDLHYFKGNEQQKMLDNIRSVDAIVCLF